MKSLLRWPTTVRPERLRVPYQRESGNRGEINLTAFGNHAHEGEAGGDLFRLNRPALGFLEVVDVASGSSIGTVIVLAGARFDSRFARPHHDGLVVMANRQAYLVARS